MSHQDFPAPTRIGLEKLFLSTRDNLSGRKKLFPGFTRSRLKWKEQNRRLPTIASRDEETARKINFIKYNRILRSLLKILDISEIEWDNGFVGCKKYLFGSQKVARVLLKTPVAFFLGPKAITTYLSLKEERR